MQRQRQIRFPYHISGRRGIEVITPVTLIYELFIYSMEDEQNGEKSSWLEKALENMACAMSMHI